jgi:hypothetical protein
MALHKSAIALIGRTHPEIFDLFGNPYGPYANDRLSKVGLNPQPLPPREVPVGVAVGYLAGVELIKLAFTASKLRVGFDIDIDDWCPTPPRRPKVPPIPWPPIPWGRADHDEGETWSVDYPTGLALALEMSQHVWEGLHAADALNGVLEQALGNAQEGLG